MKSRHFGRYALSLAVAMAGAGLAEAPANAATQVWTGGIGTVWENAANWNSGGGITWASGDVATFNTTFANAPTIGANTSNIGLWLATGVTQDVTISSGAFTLNLVGTTTINGNLNTAILLDDSANHNLTIAAGGTTAVLNSTSFLVNNAGTLTLQGTLAITAAKTLTLGGTNASGNIVISGSTTATTGILKINTAGTVTLSGTNLNTGTTALTAGRLNITNVSALGLGGLTLTSGTLANTSGSAMALSSNGAITLGGTVALGDAGDTGGAGDITFGTGSFSYSVDRTLNLNGTGATFTFGGKLRQTDASNNHTLTVNGAGNTLSVAGFDLMTSGANGRTQTVTGTANIVINGVVGNTGNTATNGLTYSGSGTMTFLGTNVYKGTTTISAGATMQVGNGGTTGDLGTNTSGVTNSGALIFNRSDASAFTKVISGTGTVTLKGGGALTLSGASSSSGQWSVLAGTLAIATINNASANGTLGNSTKAVILGDTGGVTGTLEYTGATASSTKRFTMAAGGTGAFQVDTAATVLTLSGAIDGTGNLNKLGDGTLSLTSGNTYSGSTTVTAGTLISGVSGAFANTTALNVNGGTLDMNNFGIASGKTLLFASGGLKNVLEITGSGMAKTTAGTLVLGGTNAYSGNTAISEGTLQLGADNVIPYGIGKGNVSVTGTLDMNTHAASINGLSGSGIIDTVAGGAAVLTVGNNNAAGSFSGVIQNTAGTLALIKTGSGALTLSNTTNSYAGGTTINGGVVQVSHANNLGVSTGDVTINNGTLQVTSGFSSTRNIIAGDVNSTILVNAGQTYSNTGTLSATGAGVLNINSATATGTFAYSGTSSAPIQFNSGVLAASGTLNGAVSGGAYAHTFAPGGMGTVGSLALGSTLSLNAQSTLNFDVVDDAVDTLSLAGALSLSGLPNLTFASSGTPTQSQYSIATFTTPVTGLTNSNFAIAGLPSGYHATVSSSGITLDINVAGPSLLNIATTGVLNTRTSSSGTPGSVLITNLSTSDDGQFAASGTNVTIGNPTGTVVHNGSGTGAAPVNVNWNDVSVAGARSGSIGITNTDNPSDTSNQSQALSGGVYDYANATYAAGNVAIGAVRVGESVTLAVSNTTVSDATYQDTLTTSGSTNNARVGVTGFSGLAAGAGSQNVVFTATAAGDLASSVSLNLDSVPTAVGLTGQTTTDSANITTTGTAYRLAVGSLGTVTVDLGHARLNGTFTTPTQSITVTNVASTDGFSDDLEATATTSSTGFTATGTTAALAAGASDASTLSFTFNGSTATAGTVNGTINVGYTSKGQSGTGLADVAAGSQNIAVTGVVYNGLSTWTTTGSGTYQYNNWSNWNLTGGIPGIDGASSANNDTANFANIGVTGTFTVNLDGTSPILKTISFSDDGLFTLAQGTGSAFVTMDAGAGAATISVAGAHTQIISAPITLNSSLSVSGAGSLTLSGILTQAATGKALTYSGSGLLALDAANSYDGGTTINSGTVRGLTSTSLGSGTILLGNTSLANAATVQFGGGSALTGGLTIANNITVQAGNTGTMTITSANTSGTNTLAGGTITLGKNVTFNVATGGTLQVDDQITGAFAVTKSGAGKIVLNNASNGYTGLTISAGTLDLNGNSQSVATFTQNGGATLVTGAGTLTVTTSATINGGIATGANIALADAATLFITQFGNVNYMANLTFGNASIKSDDGAQNIQTYTVSTWTFGADKAVSLVSGDTTASHSEKLVVSGSVTLNGTNGLNTSGNALTTPFAATAGTPITFGVIVSSSTSNVLTKTGAADLTFNADNTGKIFTLNVNDGTAVTSSSVVLTAANALGSATVNVKDHGILFAGSVTNALGSATINLFDGGTLQLAGANNTTYGGNVTVGNSTIKADDGNASVNEPGRVYSINNLTFGNGKTLTVTSGTNSGAEPLTVAGTTTINGANTISIDRATVTLTAVTPTAAGDSLTLAAGPTTAFGKLVLLGTSTYTGLTTISGDKLQLGDGTATNGSVTGDIVNNATLIIANPLSQSYAGAISGTGLISKIGAGKLTLSGTNSYAGTTTISEGTVQFAKQVSLYNNNVGGTSWTDTNIVVATGATLALNVGGTDEFTSADVATISALGTPTGGFAAGSTLALDTSNAAGGNFDQAAAITNANSIKLVKLGANTLTLSTTNTYTGATTVTAGTLAVTGTINTTSGLTVASGATATLANGLSNAAAAVSNAGSVAFNGASAIKNLADPAGYNTAAYAGSTTVAANLTTDYIRQASLTITAGKTTLNESVGTLASGWPGGSNDNVSVLKTLTLTGGTLDVINNDLVIDYAEGFSPFDAIDAAVRTGYASGAWTGTGIISSDAAALNYFTLLVLDTADTNDNYTAAPAGLTIDATSVIVKFTHQDDLDGNGVVNAADKAIFTSHWVDNQTGATHRFGDMDFDGVYTFNDVQLFNLYYNTALPSLPEPGSLALLALGAAGLLARKRR